MQNLFHTRRNSDPLAQSHRGELAKRTQFDPAPAGTKSCTTKDYVKELPIAEDVNKANQSRQHPAGSEQTRADGPISGPSRQDWDTLLSAVLTGFFQNRL